MTIQKIYNKMKRLLRRDAVNSVTFEDGYYDELPHGSYRVHICYPGVATVTIVAEFTNDLYDTILYLLHTQYTHQSVDYVNRVHSKCHLYYQGKVLRREQLPLNLYNMQNDGVVRVEMHSLLGGTKEVEGQTLYRLYTHVYECEKQIERLELQSQEYESSDGILEDGSYARSWNSMMKMIDVYLQTCTKNSSINVDYVVKLLEDVQIFIKMLVNSKTVHDYQLAVIAFAKFRSSKAIFTIENARKLIQYCQDLFSSDLETQSVEEMFGTAKIYLNSYEELRNAPIFKKLYKLAMYALSFSLFDSIGLNFDFFQYSKLEAEALKRKFYMGPDFIHTLLSTLVFLCERGWQCFKTGSFDPIYHSGSQYEKWFDRAKDLKHRSTLLAFPEAHGFTLFEYLADIRECIEQGDAIYKHAIRVGEYERKMVKALVDDLKMILASQTTKREAQKERKAPFCVCLYGGSSIGKTTLTDMLFLQYAKVFNLPCGSEFKYTHNPTAKYWDGFNSSQWFVIMDDIAFMHPNKASEGDPSVMETLQTNNRVAFVPDQAALEDKGRTPFRARCVVATTNCEDLNAVHYFQTPLAMQRRFPFTIDVRVKAEYAKNGCMLDSSKTAIQDGKWPDYWNFIVKRPVPASNNRVNQRAKLEVVEKFSDSASFLAWFARAAVEHERVQNLVETSGQNMAQIEVCKECYFPINQCECLKAQSGWTLTERARKCALDVGLSVVKTNLFHQAFVRVLDTQFVQRSLEEAFVASSDRLDEIYSQDTLEEEDVFEDASEGTVEDDEKFSLRIQFYRLGEKVKSNIGLPELLGLTIAACGAILGGWKLFRTLNPAMNLQGNVSSSIGVKPVGEEKETENVWFRDEYELSSFDVSPLAASWKSLSQQDITKKLSSNTIGIRCIRECAGKFLKREGKAVCVGGHIYMTNNHNLSEDGDLKLDIISGGVVQGVSQNISVRLAQTEIRRYPKLDVCFFRLLGVPVRKRIDTLFAKSAVKVKTDGVLLGRELDGLVKTIPVRAIQKSGAISVDSVDLIESWSGIPQIPTQVGDCGAILVAFTPLGPQILGLHTLGNGVRVVASSISQELITEVIESYSEPLIEAGEPMLSSSSVERKLGDLNKKSVMRYLEEGTANVYGSFEGFRQTPKSRVTPSILQEAIKEEGYSVKHDKPVMKGWKPWRIAALDMVKPVTQLDSTILVECKKGFLGEILAALPPSELQKIQVYDDCTTLNGAPGVKFVDKMNRNTSMGNPWKKGKKHFLNPVEQDGLTDAMEFTPEISERIDTIIQRYQSGHRVMPNFCGHLKDEAVTFKKVQSGKTRVFLGGPGDWSFVVRKYLLSVIRVIQSNKFVFETAVGTNACSTEWQEIRSYLTQFGENRMIAGDYGSFDKSMPPCIILAAFDILRELCREAGYTHEDLMVVQGIAEDTAFPLVDFNGDLVEFYGSNPSGHPLTVIINSIANSLYMRYCYTVLNPKHTSRTFKQDVALMTYGDDNVMGVSPAAPWFTHTTIQQTLADVGIKYTMAEKEAASIPYIGISDVSFLKRVWRWDADVGAYLAPLEEDSIIKSLTVVVSSKTLSPQFQAIATLESAHSEFFFYGKEKFQEKSDMIARIITKCDLWDYVREGAFPSWEQLRDRFWRCSGVDCQHA
jgi:hypothetical protein